MWLIRFILSTLESIITGIFDAGFGALGDLIHKEPQSAYDASFNKHPSSIANAKEHGFSVNGSVFCSSSNALLGQVTYAPSGAGKTSNIIIPFLLNSIGKSNKVVNDPSGEILLATAAAMIAAGDKVIIFDPSKPHISCKFNPLARVKNKSDATKLAQLLILNTLGNKASDQFWQLSGIQILSLIFQLLAFHSLKKYCTIHNALYLIEQMSYGNKVDSLIVATNSEPLISAYKSFLANDPKVAGSILSTVKSALGLFQTDTVIQVTSTDTLSFEELRSDSGVCLFINNSISDSRFFAPLTVVLLQQLYDFLMEKLPKKEDKHLFFILDEAASLTFPGLALVLANSRKHLFSTSLIYQSPHQISSQYSPQELKSIEANCWLRCYLPGTPLDVAATVSREVGDMEVTDVRGVKRVQPVISPNQVKEFDGVIAFAGRYRALKLPLHPYYKTRFKKLTELPPYEPPVDDALIVPPLIPLNG